MHHDLTLYVDDCAIFAVSRTTLSATELVVQGFEQTLNWLSHNSLMVNPTKMELIIFTPYSLIELTPTSSEVTYKVPSTPAITTSPLSQSLSNTLISTSY